MLDKTFPHSSFDQAWPTLNWYRAIHWPPPFTSLEKEKELNRIKGEIRERIQKGISSSMESVSKTTDTSVLREMLLNLFSWAFQDERSVVKAVPANRDPYYLVKPKWTYRFELLSDTFGHWLFPPGDFSQKFPNYNSAEVQLGCLSFALTEFLTHSDIKKLYDVVIERFYLEESARTGQTPDLKTRLKEDYIADFHKLAKLKSSGKTRLDIL